MTDNEQTMKRCPKCGEWKPREAFYRDTARADGLQSCCKVCREDRRRVYRAENAERIRDQKREYAAANAERIREYNRQYSATNREHKAEYNRQYHAENATHIAVRKARYYDANKQERRRYGRVYSRAYRVKNPDYTRSYRILSPEAGRLAKQRRRARKLSLPDTFTPADWQYALDAFGGCCAVCGRPPGLWHTLAADHWVPLSKGGGTTPDNIVPLCHSLRDGEGSCNPSKHGRDALEWLMEKYGPRKGRAIFKRIQAWLDSRRAPYGTR